MLPLWLPSFVAELPGVVRFSCHGVSPAHADSGVAVFVLEELTPGIFALKMEIQDARAARLKRETSFEIQDESRNQPGG
jgi:hypothetical protein